MRAACGSTSSAADGEFLTLRLQLHSYRFLNRKPRFKSENGVITTDEVIDVKDCTFEIKRVTAMDAAVFFFCLFFKIAQLPASGVYHILYRSQLCVPHHPMDVTAGAQPLRYGPVKN